MKECKTCTVCCQEKLIGEFSKDKQKWDGLYPQCKSCVKIKMDKWAFENKDHLTEYHKKYNKENKQKRKEYRVKTKDHIASYMRRWREKNKDHIKQYDKMYHNTVEKKDINFRILHSLRGRLLQALKSNPKVESSRSLVGCTIEYLKSHLEKQFKGGMNWDNYGRKGWHIDHIKPCASFDLSKLEEQQKCFHYTNLQPLWWLDNCIKNKY